MHAAMPRSRKMMRRSQTRPIPHIIPIGMSVICIIMNPLPSSVLREGIKTGHQEGGEHARVLSAAVPMTIMRSSIVTVAAQCVIAGNLLRGQQRPLSQMSFQVNGSEIALQDCYRVELGAQRRRLGLSRRFTKCQAPLRSTIP